MPRNIPTSSNQDPLYINVNYKAGDIEQPSIQDNTRVVFPYLIRPRILKYRVPYVSIDGVVLNAWLSKLDLLTGAENIVFSFSAPGNTSEWRVRFELGVVCRGPTQPQDGMVKLGTQKPEEIKEKDEEDKKEIDEIKEIKREIKKLRKRLKNLKENNKEEYSDDDWFDENGDEIHN